MLFLGKKYFFFHAKLQYLGGWVLFLSKNDNFRYFLQNEGGGAGGHPAPSPRASMESTSLFLSPGGIVAKRTHQEVPMI